MQRHELLAALGVCLGTARRRVLSAPRVFLSVRRHGHTEMVAKGPERAPALGGTAGGPDRSGEAGAPRMLRAGSAAAARCGSLAGVLGIARAHARDEPSWKRTHARVHARAVHATAQCLERGSSPSPQTATAPRTASRHPRRPSSLPSLLQVGLGGDMQRYRQELFPAKRHHFKVGAAGLVTDARATCHGG